jgi:hypothetical protein
MGKRSVMPELKQTCSLAGFSAVIILGHAALLDNQMIPDAAAWEAPVRETA